MVESKIIKTLLSFMLTIIIDNTFSITEIVKKMLEDSPPVQGYGWLHPFIILCFFLAEMGISYLVLEITTLFDRMGLN